MPKTISQRQCDSEYVVGVLHEQSEQCSQSAEYAESSLWRSAMMEASVSGCCRSGRASTGSTCTIASDSSANGIAALEVVASLRDVLSASNAQSTLHPIERGQIKAAQECQ